MVIAVLGATGQLGSELLELFLVSLLLGVDLHQLPPGLQRKGLELDLQVTIVSHPVPTAEIRLPPPGATRYVAAQLSPEVT